MLCGEGVCWHLENNIIFHDGENDPDIMDIDPDLMNFDKNNLQSIKLHLRTCWEACIANKVSLPLDQINCLLDVRNVEDLILVCYT